MLGWNVVGGVKHLALLPVVVEFFAGPSDKLVARDQAAAFQLRQAGNGGEQVVLEEDEDFVRGTFFCMSGG